MIDWAVRELLIPDVKSPDGCQILFASGYNKPKSEPPPASLPRLRDPPYLVALGLGGRPISLNLANRQLVLPQPQVFTCQFRSQYRRTRREVFSILSRIQNIGYEMGENGRTPEWYRANHRTPWVAQTITQSQFG